MGEAHGQKRYVNSSVKGADVIDWSDRRRRQKLLTEIVAHADRMLELARQAQGRLRADSGERLATIYAAESLGQILRQDVKHTGVGPGHCGRVKTKFQLYLSTTVANLALLESKVGACDEISADQDRHGARQFSAVDIHIYRRNPQYWQFRALITFIYAMLTQPYLKTGLPARISRDSSLATRRTGSVQPVQTSGPPNCRRKTRPYCPRDGPPGQAPGNPVEACSSQRRCALKCGVHSAGNAYVCAG